jgi:hypothetical protein
MFKFNYNLDKSNDRSCDQKHISNISNIFNKDMNYYVCGSGGCGSTIIYNYLKFFGNSYHIHDRHPPNKLCYVGHEKSTEDVHSEWFNKTEIPEDKLNNYKVIFIYRHPIEVIFSRFAKPNGPNINHMKNVQCDNDGNIRLNDILTTKKDLYGLEDFFDNYTIPKNRNYVIYCVKYENLFDNFSLFNRAIGIPDIDKLYPKKVETKKKYVFLRELYNIYYPLMLKTNNMKFIQMIYPLPPIINNNENKDESK